MHMAVAKLRNSQSPLPLECTLTMAERNEVDELGENAAYCLVERRKSGNGEESQREEK
jgi:hypothetical protein